MLRTPALVAAPVPSAPLPSRSEHAITTIAWHILLAKLRAAKNIPALFCPVFIESYCARSAKMDEGIMFVIAMGMAITSPMSIANGFAPMASITRL